MTNFQLPLIAKGAPGYDAARERVTWNKRLEKARSPAAIAEVRSRDEVSAAVQFARENRLQISPRGGGHHYEAAALRDGGLLVDLGALKRIDIDPESRTAWIGAGVQGGELSEALAKHGFAFSVGHCVDVGVSGYLLAGGFGWNAGEWGAACGDVLEIEAVLAGGEIVRASEREHADLWWAARGHGPGFFALVTAFRLRLRPLPPAVHAWRAMFRAEDAPRLADWLNAATATADRSVEVGTFLLSAPDSGVPAVIERVSACGENADEARGKLASFASPPSELDPLWEPKGEPLAFTELPRLSPMPAGKRVAADHLWSDAPPGELLREIHTLLPPSADSTVDIVAFGGNAPVALPDQVALSVTGRTGAGIYALWDDPADDAVNREWVRRVDDALAPLRTGRYAAEADLTLGSERVAECFTPEALARLRALRARYDPEGLFFAYP